MIKKKKMVRWLKEKKEKGKGKASKLGGKKRRGEVKT